MAFAFVPFYIKVLGVEAYGVIGFFAILQAGMAVLDAGISPVLNREVALFDSGRERNVSGLLRSLEIIGFGVGAAFLVVMFFGSDWIAARWINSTLISTETIRFSVFSMVGVVCFRFFESLYKSVLAGLQRQVLLNSVNVVLSTLRNAGAAGVLLMERATLENFFLWQLVVSVFSVLICLLVVYRSLSMWRVGIKFDFAYLKRVRVFVVGAMSAALLAFFLSQIDKILLSHSLDLIDFSYYSIAAAVAGALSLLVGPVSQAIYPHLVSVDVFSERVRVYRKACRLIALVVVPVAGVIVFFPVQVLYGWTGDRVLSEKSHLLLSILAAGNLFSGLMVFPFMLEYVGGRVGLVVKANIFALFVFSIYLILFIPSYGGVGAAFGWLFLNLCYFVLMGWVAHRGFPLRDKLGWYIFDVASPCFVVAAICAIFNWVNFSFSEDRWGGVFVVFLSWLSSGVLVFLLGRLLSSRFLLSK
ncbi:MAG: hypothetical protein C0466_00830 [Candidatus Accumulibacter sp.]|nr:hypothetical protein [Accumulibacter sp.]